MMDRMLKLVLPLGVLAALLALFFAPVPEREYDLASAFDGEPVVYVLKDGERTGFEVAGKSLVIADSRSCRIKQIDGLERATVVVGGPLFQPEYVVRIPAGTLTDQGSLDGSFGAEILTRLRILLP